MVVIKLKLADCSGLGLQEVQAHHYGRYTLVE